MEKNTGLISLATKCHLISPEQEERLSAILSRRRQDLPGYTEIDLFKETSVLTSDHVQFLLAVKEHLKLKLMDKEFGDLGIANRFVQPDNVRKALDLQSDIFKKTRQSKLISDILFENKQISLADKTAILLTQDRIDEDCLAEAMNDIASSAIEQLTINMRFGAIAVKKGVISLRQLNQALRQQKLEQEQLKQEQEQPAQGKNKQAGSGKTPRYLGEILKEQFDLSEEDLRHILKIQKELEKKRLSLETALSRYYSESRTGKRLSRCFEYHFSKNKLQAYIRKVDTPDVTVEVGDFKKWLRSLGITYGIIPAGPISHFLNEAPADTQICIAKGVPPKKGRNGSVQYFFPTTPGLGNDDDTEVPLVQKGDILARIFPPEPGKPGKDISGFAISPPRTREVTLYRGQGVVRHDDIYIAEYTGVATLYKDRTLFVQAAEGEPPLRQISGWVDSDLGSTYQDENLDIDGHITASGRVQCRRLTITGDVLGQVYAAGEIHVNGAIGQENGEHEVRTRLVSDHDIHARKRIVHADLISGKGIKAPKTDLVASYAAAFQDIVVNNILSDPSGPCTIEIGKQPSRIDTPFDASIDALRATQRELENHTAFETLEQQFAAKMSARDKYQMQYTLLTFLLALDQYPHLASLPSLRDKLDAACRYPENYPNLPAIPAQALSGSEPFLKRLYAQTKEMTPDERRSQLEEMAHINRGMHRAAVNAVERHHHAYQQEKKALEEQVRGRAAEIDQVREQIRELISRRDAFFLRRELLSKTMAPALKVKNRIQKGTLIKGTTARLTVDRDMYGVKFLEYRRSPEEALQIHIEGLYE